MKKLRLWDRWEGFVNDHPNAAWGLLAGVFIAGLIATGLKNGWS